MAHGMNKKHIGLRRVAEWQLTPEQRLANMHKRLLTLVESYNASTNPCDRMDIRLDAMDMVRQIEALEAKMV